MIRTSVILVSYGGSKDTAACVRSLLNSSTPVEIVVVDTTPHDRLLAAALSFAPDVILLRAESNVGFGAGNNLGIEWIAHHRQTEFIFLLNNDTVIFIDTITALEHGMDADPHAGILTPRIAYLDRPDLLWYGGAEVDWRRSGAVAPGFNQSSTAQLALEERDVSFASGCALFFRRQALRTLGGFDPRFFMYEEDFDLCVRAAKNGIRIHYLPQSLLLHKAQGSSRDGEEQRSNFFATTNPRLPFLCYHIFRNRALNILLHARGRNLIAALLGFPLLALRRMLPMMLAGRWDAIGAMLRGVRDAGRSKDPIALPEWPAEVNDPTLLPHSRPRTAL